MIRVFYSILIAIPLAAQLPPAPQNSPLDSPPRVGIGVIQQKLGLDEALETAMRNNLEIAIERTNVDTARQSVQAARGFFDPTFRWQPLLDSRNVPTGSVLQGAGGKLNDKLLNQNFYLRQRLAANGTSFGVDFENQRENTSNPFSSFNPVLSSRLTLSVTQPIMRNRLTDQTRTELKIRRKQVDISEADFEARVIDVISRVEQAYWDLVAARQDTQVKADSVEWARQQLAITQRLVNSGTQAPIEISASEAELERRQDTYLTAVGVVTETENALKALLAPDRADPIWGVEIIPTDDTLRSAPATDDLREGVRMAIGRRPELRRVTEQQASNTIQKSFAADQRKPQVDFVAAYVNQGLGGTLRPGDNPITASTAALYQQLNTLLVAAGQPAFVAPSFGTLPDYLYGGYGTALSNLFSGRYQGFQVGLSIDLNLRNRTATANYGQTLINEKRLGLERARVEQAIEAQVRNALQGIQTARQRQAAAEASAKAAKEKLESEMRLYSSGESTNFLVLTRQNEYADSRRRVVVATLDYNKSVSRLAQAIGATLESHKIALH